MCSLAQGRQFDWKIIPTALLREGDYLSEHICRLRGITHLFELIDNDLLDCINGSCGGAKGCSSNPSKILATLASLEIVDPNDLHHEAERVDILITKRWLQSKIWLVCVTHGLLVVPQIIPELGLEYPLDLLQHAVTALSQNPVSAFEANGKAMVSQFVGTILTPVCQTERHCLCRQCGPDTPKCRAPVVPYAIGGVAGHGSNSSSKGKVF